MEDTNIFGIESSSISQNLPKRKAQEPHQYIKKEKKCNLCKKSNIIFKFLNNKKIDQLRYQCLDCTTSKRKPHFFNPFPKREHVHKNGYAKLPKVETEELKNLTKICDKC